MTPTHKLSRRSFVARIGGGAAAAVGLAALGGGEAAAFQTTDSDFGANSDPPGRGRGNAGRSGITDRDPSDPAGNGRGLVINPQASTGAGAQSDPTNSGASGSGAPGATASPGAASGAGRRCTDSDLSPGDPAGRGRRC